MAVQLPPQDRSVLRRASQADVAQRRSIAIELGGPAGSGKTTLGKLLCEDSDYFVRAPLPGSIECVRQLPSVALNSLLPSYLRRRAGDPYFSWAEVRSMLYLRGWLQSLTHRRYQGRVAIYDHGPAYRLAVLREFGPRAVEQAAFKEWWQQTFDAWSRRLCLVVWLDAPDEQLLDRIRRRAQSHACKTLAAEQASALLRRYRGALEDVVAALQRAGGVRVLRFATDQYSPSEIAEAVASEVARISEVTDVDAARHPVTCGREI